MNLTSLFFALGLASLVALYAARRGKLPRRERLAASLSLFLYGCLFYMYLRWPDTPRDVLWILYGAFALGVAGAAGELISSRYHQFAARRRNLALLKKRQGPLYELVLACEHLSANKVGGLIVLERRTHLSNWIRNGILIDAHLSKELLSSIFMPPGDLHDGAVMIHKGRIASAGVILPLTKSVFSRKDLGTRHRAAIGMSEVCDALCLIVSEETGEISIADRGQLYDSVPAEELSDYLYDGLRFRTKRRPRKAALQSSRII